MWYRGLYNVLLIVGLYLLVGIGWVVLTQYAGSANFFSDQLIAHGLWQQLLLVIMSGLLFGAILFLFQQRYRIRLDSYKKQLTTYHHLFLHSHLPIWIVTRDTHAILQMNAAAQQLFELSDVQAAAGLYLQDLIDERDRYLIKLYFTPETISDSLGVWRFRTHTGKLVYLSLNLQATEVEGRQAMLAVANDVSSIVAAEEERYKLHNELLTYKKALDRSAMLSVMDLNGEILDVNYKFCEVTQYSPEEILGKSQQLLDTNYRDATYFQKMYDTLNSGEIWRDEFRNRAKDGRIFWVDMSVIPVYDGTNSLHRYMAIAYPITSKKRAERLSEAIHEEFATFMYKTSHKLRGPVATLAGLSELARMEVRDDTACHYLKLLDERIRHLDFTLDEIVAITKIKQESIASETVDFDALVQEVLEQLKGLIEEHHIRVFCKVSSDIHFKSDGRLLRSLLFYLLDNACRFRSNENPSLWLSIIPKNKGVQISVCDNGPGIAQAIRARIFEMYFRGNEKSKGSGLGLYIVKSIVEQLEGFLQLRSKEEGGKTEFKIYLPEEIKREQIQYEREYIYLQREPNS